MAGLMVWRKVADWVASWVEKMVAMLGIWSAACWAETWVETLAV